MASDTASRDSGATSRCNSARRSSARICDAPSRRRTGLRGAGPVAPVHESAPVAAASQRCCTACSAVASHSRHCVGLAPAACCGAPGVARGARLGRLRLELRDALAELGDPGLGLGVGAPPLPVGGLAHLLLDGPHPRLQRADVVARDLADRLPALLDVAQRGARRVRIARRRSSRPRRAAPASPRRSRRTRRRARRSSATGGRRTRPARCGSAATGRRRRPSGRGPRPSTRP